MPPIGLFSALADETRCTILRMLRNGPMPVHKLAIAFDISRPAISRHLRVLGEAGLVRERKKGRENFYELRAAPLKKGQIWICDLLPRDSAGPNAKLRKVTVKNMDAQAAPDASKVSKPRARLSTEGSTQVQMTFDL